MSIRLHGVVAAALIVSLSGLAERELAGCIELADELDSRLVPVSWLLPPRPHGGRHRPDGPVIGWLRQRIDVGDALVQHGFDHTVDPMGRWATGSVAKLGRRAEFAALPSHEAALRLIAAARWMDELGLRTDVFAPPRWLASAGTLVALRERGFRVCADSTGVRLLGAPGMTDQMLRGRVLDLGATPPETAEAWLHRVLGLGATPPETAEGWRHRVLVASAARAARRRGLVRLAVQAVQAGEPRRPTARRALLEAVDAALAAGARPTTYHSPTPEATPLSA
jgi:hypothetical protein